MRIIVADDHPLVQEALGNVLARAFPAAEILPCLTLRAAADAVEANEADVDLVLLDLDMQDSQGFAGLFQLLASHSTVPVAILSATEDPATIRRAIAYGASGYVPKSLEMARMAEAVRAILAGEVWYPPSADYTGAPRDGGAMDADAEWARRFATLSAQQLRILTMLTEGRLNKQIAGDLGIAEQTVKIHVSTILRKLGVISRTQAAVAAERLSARSARQSY